MMLFKSLLNRVTSGSGSESLRQSDGHRRYATATFEKFPSLSSLLIRLLQKSVTGEEGHPAASERELGFPAIQMIERIGILPDDRQTVSELLSQHLESPLWIIRENAAKALSSLTKLSHIIDAVEGLLTKAFSQQNRLHGLLLCLEFMLKERSDLSHRKFKIF